MRPRHLGDAPGVACVTLGTLSLESFMTTSVVREVELSFEVISKLQTPRPGEDRLSLRSHRGPWGRRAEEDKGRKT